jgi:metallo-beta-lactamase family protein
MRITFLGAASEVTGSQHLIETDRIRLLLDCGLFQGPRAPARAKNEVFHCRPKDLDGVVLSHAHIDHCGNLPRLWAAGFRGPIFCTDATADITELMLRDSARVQAEDAKYLSRKLRRGHPPVEPLYTEDDVDGVLRLFQPLKFHEWHDLGHGVEVRFLPAGHILGSAISELKLKDGSDIRRVVFTGDLGRRGMPLLVDPESVDGADVLICESTYGNRAHSEPGDTAKSLLEIFRRAVEQQGKVIIPAFSLGRTQQLVYSLNQHFHAGELPRIPIFVDSPLATRLTKIFRRYNEILDEDVQLTRRSDDDVFGFDTLTYVEKQPDSMALNQRQGPFVVISASGMCEGGRVVHHIKHAVGDARNTICLLGYQAPHTLGWQLAQRRDFVRIFDRDCRLNARVEQLSGLSAHADVVDFKWWFEACTRTGHSFGQTFLVHGEPEAAQGLADLIRDDCDEAPHIPAFRETVVIE